MLCQGKLAECLNFLCAAIVGFFFFKLEQSRDLVLQKTDSAEEQSSERDVGGGDAKVGESAREDKSGDTVDSNQNKAGTRAEPKTKSTEEQLLDMTFLDVVQYLFYLPTYTSGPILTFQRFNPQVNKARGRFKSVCAFALCYLNLNREFVRGEINQEEKQTNERELNDFFTRSRLRFSLGLQRGSNPLLWRRSEFSFGLSCGTQLFTLSSSIAFSSVRICQSKFLITSIYLYCRLCQKEKK